MQQEEDGDEATTGKQIGGLFGASVMLQAIATSPVAWGLAPAVLATTGLGVAGAGIGWGVGWMVKKLKGK